MERDEIDYSTIDFTNCVSSSWSFTCASKINDNNPYKWENLIYNIKRSIEELPGNIEIIEIVFTREEANIRYKKT